MDIKLKDDKDFPKEYVEQLVELYQVAEWAKDRSPAGVLKMLENSTIILTLRDGNKLVGFTRVLSDLIYRAVILDVIVSQDYQGRGLGKRLVEAVVEHPSLETVGKFWLTAAVPDFYRKLGFVEEGKSMVLDRYGETPCSP